MCTRIVKNAVKVMQGKETIPNLFDEAQFIVMKEILPYWAGFMKTYQPPDDITTLPCTCYIVLSLTEPNSMLQAAENLSRNNLGVNVS